MTVTPKASRILQGDARSTEDEKLLKSRPSPAFLDTDPWRALRIQAEFVEGFDAMANVGPAVTIFGSARTKRSEPEYELARSIARRLAEAGYAVITVRAADCPSAATSSCRTSRA
jgi:hypothetical protein